MAPLCMHEFEENDGILCAGDDVIENKIQDEEEDAFEGNSTARRIRSVSFSEEAIVHIGAVINILDYTDDEKKGTWYNIEEMRTIREEVKQTVSFMNRMIPKDKIESDSFFCSWRLCIRGLEGKIKETKRHRRSIRMKSISFVFDEQSIQNCDGISDTDMIALAYKECAYPMQVAAFERAVVYEKEEREATTETKINDNISDDDDSAIDQRPLLLSLSSNTTSTSSTTVDSKNDADNLIHVIGSQTRDEFRNGDNHSIQIDKENQLQLLEIEKTPDTEIDENDETTNNDYTVSFQNHQHDIDTNSANDEHFISRYSEIVMRDLNNNRNKTINEAINNNRNDVSGGQTRFRERFTCLLPMLTPSQSLMMKSNARRSFLGAFRVVHI